MVEPSLIVLYRGTIIDYNEGGKLDELREPHFRQVLAHHIVVVRTVATLFA
jgi:hypothetical protein